MLDDQAREYRRLAAECLAVARKTSASQLHANLIDIAKKWGALAERAEREALHCQTAQALIGEQLRDLYKTSNAMPPHLLALLAQLDDEVDTPSATESP